MMNDQVLQLASWCTVIKFMRIFSCKYILAKPNSYHTVTILDLCHNQNTPSLRSLAQHSGALQSGEWCFVIYGFLYLPIYLCYLCTCLEEQCLVYCKLSLSLLCFYYSIWNFPKFLLVMLNQFRCHHLLFLYYS